LPIILIFKQTMLFVHKNPAPKCGIFACISFVNETWSEWRDLNPRPHGPEVLSKIPLDPFGPV
ncbi:hypothetical protein, partial [uncultured Oscillibacter sp.]|uniref:hypothetical protein n=1 Tax=uncultured Oscillibacter sp. TaxID=876091 RepID=UPI00262403B5